MSDYCPYDVITDPAALDLETRVSAGAFGDLVYYRSRQQHTSDVCTVYLHGVSGEWSTWSPVLQAALANGEAVVDTILVDLPGFGASENTSGALDATVVAQEIVVILAREGYARAELVGHSMGGFLALHLASLHLVDVVRVVCLAGSYFQIIEVSRNPLAALRSQPKLSLAFLALRVAAVIQPVVPPFLRLLDRRHVLRRLLKGSAYAPDELRQSVVDSLVAGVRPRSFVLAARNGRAYDPSVVWKGISCPVLAVFGAEDHLVPPSEGERLKAIVHASELEIIPASAHLLNVERPTRVYELIWRRAT